MIHVVELLNLLFLFFAGYWIVFLHSRASFHPSSGLLSFPWTIAFTFRKTEHLFDFQRPTDRIGVDYAAILLYDPVQSLLDVLLINSPAGVLNQSRPEPEF